jgi:hypothetical protein
MTESEACRAIENDEMYIILPESLPFEEPVKYRIGKAFTKAGSQNYSSHNTRLITKKEISAVLEKYCD